MINKEKEERESENQIFHLIKPSDTPLRHWSWRSIKKNSHFPSLKRIFRVHWQTRWWVSAVVGAPTRPTCNEQLSLLSSGREALALSPMKHIWIIKQNKTAAPSCEAIKHRSCEFEPHCSIIVIVSPRSFSCSKLQFHTQPHLSPLKQMHNVINYKTAA